MHWITADHLDGWATTEDSIGKLPLLISKLVFASTASLERIRFPSGKSVGSPGWDGFVLADSSQELFLPSGPSVWEVSTESKIFAKAIRDFDKRLDISKTALPYGFKKEETTYVAVTLRKWPETSSTGTGKDSFLKYANGKGFWKDVRIVDAHDLENWISGKIAIESWLTRDVLHLPAAVPDDAERSWNHWSQRCRFPLLPEVVLAGRQEAQDRILEAVAKGEGHLTVQADSPDEAAAFIVASFLALGETDTARINFLSRAAVISDEASAKVLEDRQESMVLITRGEAESLAGALSRASHVVLIPIGNSRGNEAPNVVLKRPTRASFVQGLQLLKIPEDEAQQIARKCRCSLAVLARLYPSVSPQLPNWTNPDTLQHLIPAVLAGRWDEAYLGDQEVLANLSQHPYEKYQERIAQFVAADDPPIRRTGSIVSLTAPPDSFSLAMHHLVPAHLTRFKECVIRVFSEIDPKLDLPPSDRPFARLRGIGRKHSDWLRDGLAEALLLFSALGNDLENADISSGAAFAEGVIRQLPALSTNPLLLASLEQQLPLLMEAAPGPFLEALEQILQGPPSATGIFFADSDADSATWGGSPHTDLLWGLETLAWNPDFLPRVCLILAHLDSVDPGGRLSNRPIASLHEILLPWSPGTNASVEIREAVLDTICGRFPETGWKLCSGLLPAEQMFSTPTSEPKWHEYSRSEREPVTHSSMSSQYRALLKRVTQMAGGHPERWNCILRVLRSYAEADRLEAIANLREASVSSSEEITKLKFWHLVRDFLGSQQGFETSQWALLGPAMDSLHQLAEELAPTDPFQRHRPLFEQHFPNIGVSKREHDEYRKRLLECRLHAVQELTASRGIQGILPLISDALIPHALSEPLIASCETLEATDLLFRQLVEHGVHDPNLFSFLSGYATEKFGLSWREHFRSQAESFSDDVLVSVALGWPDDTETFSFISSLDAQAQDAFWKIKRAWTSSNDPSIVKYMIEQLSRAGRDLDALHLTDLRGGGELEASVLLALLERVPQAIVRSGEQRVDSMACHYIEGALKALRARPGIDALEIAKREYALLPLLATPWAENNLMLHEILSKDPGFFVSVICDVFRPSSRERDVPLDDLQRLRAEYGYKLLNSWKVLPGTSSAGEINEADLRAWIREARRLGEENDRADLTDQEIGKVLAYSPCDPEDQAWPHKAVRNVLEDVQSKHIRIGIEVEQHAKRGVWTKAPYEGGQQETALSLQWREWEKVVSPRWPFTGSILRSIAEEWDRCAAREDLRAEQDRIRDEH